MVLNEISRMNWIEMQFVFAVKNLSGKSGRKHAYLQYIFMNFYDKRCKLLILCAVCVHFSLLLFLRFVYKFDMFESRERSKKFFSINPFYGLARILLCVYCPVLFGILTNHIFVSKLTQMTSNQCKIQLVVELRLFCWIICNNSNTDQHFVLILNFVYSVMVLFFYSKHS